MPHAKTSIEWVTDGELVEQVRAGDTAAFGELVERHQASVYRAALAVLGNGCDAEDVAQEASCWRIAGWISFAARRASRPG